MLTLISELSVWLDIEQLTSGQVTGMFEQITSGLINSKVVCAFISSQYAQSENCKMEFQVTCGVFRFLLFLFYFLLLFIYFLSKYFSTLRFESSVNATKSRTPSIHFKFSPLGLELGTKTKTSKRPNINSFYGSVCGEVPEEALHSDLCG